MKNLNNGRLLIEDGVKEILPRQYYEQEDIETIIFPNTLEVICEEAFAGCHNITEIVFPASLKRIEAGAFFENTALNKVIFNKGLTFLGEGSFLSCEKISHLDFPDTLKEIGSMCFYGCGLEKIDLPPNIEYISDQAFWGNEKLKEVNILNPDCKLGLDIFGSCYQLSNGYIAAGYPEEMELYDEVLYSILGLTSYEKHNEFMKETLRDYAKENTEILMEKILLTGNAKALNTMIQLDALTGDTERYLEKAFEKKQNEIIALLLKTNNDKGDLEL